MAGLQIKISERQEKEGYGKYIGMAVLFLGCSLFVFKEGMLNLANDVLDFLTQKTGKIYLNYPVKSEGDAYIAALGILLLLALWTAKAIKYREKVTLVLLWIIILGTTISGLIKTRAGFLLVVLAIVIFLFPQREQEETRKKIRLLAPVFVSFICGVVCVGSLLISKDFSVKDEVEEVKRVLHKWRYESVGSVMPEGQLSDLGALEKGNQIRLQVKMEKPQKLYLRGMVGDVYTGTEWKGLEETAYLEAEDEFYWLHKTGFYGQNAIGNAILLTEDAPMQEMTIRNVAACKKYQYLPYSLVGNEVLDAYKIGDGSVLADGKEAKVLYLSGSLPEWYQAKMNLVNCEKEEKIEKYLKQEQTYRQFVYQQDLQISNSVVGVCQRVLDRKQNTGTLGEIATEINNALEAHLDYSEETVTLNGTNDFFQYTLEQSKKGYSVHYATAAVLMLRYCGVPARYVEGYYISEDEATKYKAGEWIQLTDKNTHAWAEYYLDGIGWIPFEVTPGYVDEAENQAVQNLLAGKSQPEEEQTYTQSNLNYLPALEQTQEDDSKEKEQQFLLNWIFLLKMVGIIAIIFLIIAVVQIALRKKRLCEMLERIKQADNRTAIAMYYAYAQKLKSYTSKNSLKMQEQVEQLNQEALFSNHIMTEEQRQIMKNYVKEVIKTCKESWSIGKRFWYHYILWLYR